MLTRRMAPVLKEPSESISIPWNGIKEENGYDNGKQKLFH